jgi:hypothetical protein
MQDRLVVLLMEMRKRFTGSSERSLRSLPLRYGMRGRLGKDPFPIPKPTGCDSSCLAHALRYSLNNTDRTVCSSVGEGSMQDEKQTKEELLEVLRAEVASLLCADDVSEEEKLSRIKLAQAIIESGEV